MDKINLTSLDELHKMMGLQKPSHPLITLFDLTRLEGIKAYNHQMISGDFYTVTLKDGKDCELRYGRRHYDFSEGSMSFTSPGQGLTVEVAGEVSYGWMLLFHPDLIRSSSLGNQIHDYTFFSYDVTEALHLSDKERGIVNSVVENIEGEIQHDQDSFSDELIITSIEMLLGYAKRFYGRQFITREKVSKDVVGRFSQYLKEYYTEGKYEAEGMPSVKAVAEHLGYSSNYLGDLMKNETGRNAKDHIHQFTIGKAKDMLLGSDESIAEISFRLGFQYAGNFSKFFKKNVGVSPVEYRE